MVSSPRFRRGMPATQAGTSIIAALVFAALLGAVALSLNALQSGSSNTAALPADPNAAATAITSDTVQCKAGHVYYIAKKTSEAQSPSQSPSYDIQVKNIYDTDSSGSTYIPSFTYPNPSYVPGQNVVIGDATVNLCNYIQNPNTTRAGACVRVQSPGTMDSQCISSYLVQYINTVAAAPVSCPDGKGSKGTGAEIYMSGTTVEIKQCQAGTSLQPTAGSPSTTGSGTCTNGATDYPDCKNCPYGPTSPSGGICAPAPTVTPDTCHNGADNPPKCDNCPYGQTSPSGGICNPAPNAPPASTGSCAIGNQPGTFNASGVCVPAAPPAAPPQPCQPGATSCNTCTGGQTWNGTTCAAPAAVPPPQTCPAGMTCTQTPPPGGGSNPLGSLSSLLSGLAKGLTGSNCGQSSSVGGNGTTYTQQQVQQPNGTVVTVLVPQQQTSSTGQPCTAAQPQSQQQAPYGTGTDGSACPAPPTAPQCATGATAQPISATGNGCMTGYQCVPTSSTIGQTPTPQISCSPQIADVGQSVAISYSCQNATGSSGGGFSTNNQTSGSANVTIVAPPSGTNTANYGITCTGSGQTANAQCSVQVNQPAIDLVADPQAVPAGQTTSIGWVTAGMQSCVISSPQDAGFTQANASNTSANGVAQSDAITTSTEFDLTCQTLGGQTKKASTTVTVGSAASSSASVNVSSTADGATVNHGDTVTITWDASTTPQDSAIALWLIDINTEQATALIAGDQSASGTYAWQLPAAGSTCDQSSLAPCASNLVDGDSYGIEAAVYTPQDAYLGLTVPSGDTAPTYVDYGYTATPFTVGQ